MSNRPSSITTSLAIRLPNNVYAILKRRGEKQGIRVSDYARARLVYDTLRKHRRK